MRREDAEALFEVQRASYAGLGSGLRASWPENEALDAEGFSDLLGRRRYAVLATARADGRAHASPVAFVVADGAFWFAIVRGVRLRNLHVCPWASVVVMGVKRTKERQGSGTGQSRWRAGKAVRGRGVRLCTGAARLLVGRASRPPPDWALAIIELRPERVFSHAAPE